MQYRIIVTTLFGIESLTAQEIKDLGYEASRVQVTDGQVQLSLDDYSTLRTAVARLNINLRTAERVLVELGSFDASDYDTLFQKTKELPWEDWIVKDTAFHVKGYSRKSKLYGIPSCQRIIKKAIVASLSEFYELPADDLLPEDEDLGLLKLQFGIVKDRVRIFADTSGDGLHKRGYRPLSHEAPIRETLAAAMLMLSRFGLNQGEVMYDPFCGSGTIPIEAALMQAQIAPGLNRNFAAENWRFIGGRVFELAKKQAKEKQITTTPLTQEQKQSDKIMIYASDIDVRAIEIARANADRAGVADLISFRCQEVSTASLSLLKEWTGSESYLIICNPPYGERMLSKQLADQLYLSLLAWTMDGQGYVREGVRLSVITPQRNFEQLAKGKADKRRKLYNGMIQCTMYHYFKSNRKKQTKITE